MSYYRKKIILAVVFFVTASLCHAGSPLDDSYYIGSLIDGAALGRGGAYVAVNSNPYAPYWNPAAVVNITKGLFAVSISPYTESELASSLINHDDPLDGRSLNFISVCAEQIAVYWRPLANKAVSNTGLGSNGAYAEKIDTKINMYGITVAVPHNSSMDFGMNINFITGMLAYAYSDPASTILQVSDAYGWGLDWGILYKLSEGVNWGLSVQNFPARLYWEDHGKDTLPVIVRGGVDIRLSSLMTMGIDYEKGYYDSSLDDGKVMHLGLEQYLGKNIVARAGMYGHNLNKKTELTNTYGMGYIKGNMKVDISYRQYYSEINNSEKINRTTISSVIGF